MKRKVWNYDRLQWQEVEAELVTFEGYDDYEFFLHESISRSFAGVPMWTVSETSSGCRVCGEFSKPEWAIDHAKENLLTKETPAKFLKRIHRGMKKYKVPAPEATP